MHADIVLDKSSEHPKRHLPPDYRAWQGKSPGAYPKLNGQFSARVFRKECRAGSDQWLLSFGLGGWWRKWTYRILLNLFDLKNNYIDF